MRHNYYFYSVLLAILIISVTGCTSINESSEVLHFNIVLEGNYSDPVFDLENSTRSLEMMPLLKQPKYDKVVDNPSITCRIFFKQDVISYSTSEPYKGPGTYHFTIVFQDDKTLPKLNETTTVSIKINTEKGLIEKEYFALRWP